MVHLGSANGQRILRWASDRRPSPSAGFVQVGLRNSKALQYSGSGLRQVTQLLSNFELGKCGAR